MLQQAVIYLLWFRPIYSKCRRCNGRSPCSCSRNVLIAPHPFLGGKGHLYLHQHNFGTVLAQSTFNTRCSPTCLYASSMGSLRVKDYAAATGTPAQLAIFSSRRRNVHRCTSAH